MHLFTMHVRITIKRYFQEFLELLGQVGAHRKRPVYKVEQLLVAVVGMFQFKRFSRNHADNSAAKCNYSHNFELLFVCRQLNLNISNSLLKELGSAELEQIKRTIVRLLIKGESIAAAQTVWSLSPYPVRCLLPENKYAMISANRNVSKLANYDVLCLSQK